MTRIFLLSWLATVAVILAFFHSATAAADKITICHATGSGSYQTLVLPPKAVYGTNGRSGHFNEQGTPAAGHENDYLGPCITTTTTTTTEVTPSTSTTSTTTTPRRPTTTTTSPASTSTTPTTSATTTTAPQSTSTSTPRRNTTTTHVTTDTCKDLGTCPDTTTSTTLPPDGCANGVCRGTTTVVSLPPCPDDPVLLNCEPTTTTSTSSTVPPTTLAYGGTDAAKTFAPWAIMITVLGGALSFLARRPV